MEIVMNKRAAPAMLDQVSGVFDMYAAAEEVDGNVAIQDLTPKFPLGQTYTWRHVLLHGSGIGA
ncbi:MAG: hypothetical protein Q8S96_21865 [Hydrogenophaga sp.]|uniref:hypothetical protein n=1 Tax=Hydrogenophaga sp. TaxID=1904254 RepID=UPI0027365B97|nr:hypothetical protein [Hydrogenophaga sp.]MDP3347083.1 hypothetical protein [Hydrogenophaga sp.]MDP3804949.1 hypothetical protein [Hydrogenophaga sp.]